MPKKANTRPPDPDVSTPTGPSGLRQRWWLNAALLLLIVALAWLVAHRSDKDSRLTGLPLTAATADSISQIRVERSGQERLVLEKSETEWTMTAPVRARVNVFNIENLLRVVSAPGETRIAASPGELAKFGLDSPQVRLRLNDFEIAFGSLHPLKNQVYVRHQDEVVLIPGHHLGPALYPYTQFIDSRLFEENRKLTSLKLPDFTLRLRGGSWERKPIDKKLTTDRITAFAAEWQNARALEVEKYSGREILERIEIGSTRDGKIEKTILGIVSYKPNFVLVRTDENLEYHFTEDTGRRLLKLSAGE